VAFLIVSVGRMTGSRPRTLHAKPVLLAGGLGLLLMLAACGAMGYQLARFLAPVQASPAPADADRPEFVALVDRVGTLAGRLVQLESQAAVLAERLDIPPASATLTPSAPDRSSGGPLIDVEGIDRVEADIDRLQGTFAGLSEAFVQQEVEDMAFPNRLPVAGGKIPVSSGFGTRHDPFTGRMARHTGLDIPAKHGSPILASGGGRVIFAGYKGAYGLAAVIDHGDGLSTLYGHASKLLVRAGDVVLPQQKIALVGSTGRSTGPHLHFEVIRNGQRVEPRQYLAGVLERPRDARAQ
jgi:murein DD-endopeptidase MepM/ murein hydrolase activator NlpD